MPKVKKVWIPPTLAEVEVQEEVRRDNLIRRDYRGAKRKWHIEFVVHEEHYLRQAIETAAAEPACLWEAMKVIVSAQSSSRPSKSPTVVRTVKPRAKPMPPPGGPLDTGLPQPVTSPLQSPVPRVRAEQWLRFVAYLRPPQGEPYRHLQIAAWFFQSQQRCPCQPEKVFQGSGWKQHIRACCCSHMKASKRDADAWPKASSVPGVAHFLCCVMATLRALPAGSP